MCELADGLQLCTCDASTLEDPDWVLERRDASLPEHHRRGRAMIPRLTESERACLERVVAALDDGSCFDFDYTPCDGDVLTLRHEGKRYRFRLEPGGWTVDKSTELTGWRAQMVQTHRGRRASTSGTGRRASTSGTGS